MTEETASVDRGCVDISAAGWRETVQRARDEWGMTFFDWLGGVDEGDDPSQAGGTGAEQDGGPIERIRFRVVAHLWSVEARRGVLLRTGIPATEPELASVVDIFAGAAWYERETFEMFGIVFTGHPNLRKLLLTEEFSAAPLRKDFVLASRVVKAWPGEKEPGEKGPAIRQRRRILPPGVPTPGTWGPAMAAPAARAGGAPADGEAGSA